MTEYRALGRRGNPQGKAIYYGRASPTVVGLATTGSTTVTYSPKYATEPHLIVGVPEFSQTSGGSTSYCNYHLTTKSATSFIIALIANTAPGLYKTVTMEFDYLVVGEPAD